MKIVSIVGARPQFVKIAPLAKAIRNRSAAIPSLQHIIVHTGQHYDPEMSDIFFAELQLPHSDYSLGVGSGRHGRQTGLMLSMIEQVLLKVVPDIVVIYGDTNSTAAGALASSKLNIPIAHVEAGLRSFNRRMPEEINRIVADHISDLLLAPTATAIKNLHAEGLWPRAVFTGDIMYDAVLFYRQMAKQHSQIGERLNLQPGEYALVTVHRAENTDNPAHLASLLAVFNEIASSGQTLVFPMHPRTSQRVRTMLADWQPHSRLRLVEPLGYLDTLWLIDHASMTLTDSGGLQKEAFFLDCPCITLREETEWIETVHAGGNVLAGTDAGKIRAAVAQWQTSPQRKTNVLSQRFNPSFGDGNAAGRILDTLLQFANGNREAPTDTFANQFASISK